MCNKKAKKLTPSVPGQSWGFRTGICELRKASGMTQQQLADRIGGASQDVITRLERGVSRGLSVDVLEGLVRVAREFGFSADWLIDGRECLASCSKEDLVKELRFRACAEVLNENGLFVETETGTREIAAEDIRRAGGILEYIEALIGMRPSDHVRNVLDFDVNETLRKLREDLGIDEQVKKVAAAKAALDALCK